MANAAHISLTRHFSTLGYLPADAECLHDIFAQTEAAQHVSLTFSDDEDEGKELSVPDPEPLAGRTRDLQRKNKRPSGPP